MLPKLSLISLSCGVALSVTSLPWRSITIVSDSPELMLTMRCMSEKLSICSPLMDKTRSPGWKPAALAALAGCTASTRALVVCLPTIMKMPAKMAIASMKLAIGPGRHDRSARAHLLPGEADLLLGFAHGGAGVMVGHARRIVVAEEFHIAAERDGRDLPAGAVAVIEADEFRTEAERECEHFDAAPAGHQKVAKLVKENDNRQHKQERDQIAEQSPAERAQARHNVEMHYYPSSRPPAR